MKIQWAGLLLGTLSLSVMAQDETPAAADSGTVAAPIASASTWSQLAGRIYLSPQLSYSLVDSGRQTDNGIGGVLSVGKAFTSELAVEAALQYSAMDKESGGGSAKLAGLGLNTLFFPAKDMDGYLLLGAGYGDVSSHPGGESSYGTLLLNLGGGYWWKPFDFLMPGISLRTEAMVRIDAHNDRRTGDTVGNGRKAFDDLVFNVGVVIPVGSAPSTAAPPVPVVPVAVVAVADADGDGVVDDSDQCPDTPAGTSVDATGCPAAAAEPPLPVVAACKTPGPGEKLDLAACGTGDVIVLKGVNFEFDKDRLTANAKTILGGVSEALQSQPQINVEIGGHTDAKGSDSYNAALSERRACSVTRYLGTQGIDDGRMTPKGYGEASAVADNETDEGRELNRRVELKIIEGAGSGSGSCPSAKTPRAVRAAAAPAAVEAESVADEPYAAPAVGEEPSHEAEASIGTSEPEPSAETPSPAVTESDPPRTSEAASATAASAPVAVAPQAGSETGSQAIEMVPADEVF